MPIKHSYKFLLIIFFSYLVIVSPSFANKCFDQMLFDGTEKLATYAIDSTGNWWAVTQPFSDNYRLCVNGKKTKVYQNIQAPVFSNDGERWACFVKDYSQWYLLTNDTIISLSVFLPGVIKFSPNSEHLVYSYFEGSNEHVVLPGRTFTIVNRLSDIFLSMNAEKFAFTGYRGDKQVLNVNGVETSISDSVLPVGFWYDGRFVYASLTGSNWEIYRADQQLTEFYQTIIDYKINLKGTVVAFLVRQPGGKALSVLISDEYREPLLGKPYDAINSLALHPELAMIAFKAVNYGVNYVVLNNTEYFGGTESTGPPQFSYNGEELFFTGYDLESFININGVKTSIQAQLDTELRYAKKPGSNTIAYSTSSSMIMRDIKTGTLYAGMMTDNMIQPIYNWKKGCYEALGNINNRLYQMVCYPE